MVNEHDLSINKRIHHYRRLKGLTQKDMAELLGVKSSTYAQRENKGKIDCRTLIQIADILDVDIRLLLYGGIDEDQIYKRIERELHLKYKDYFAITKKDLNFLKGFHSMSKKRQTAVLNYYLDVYYKRIEV